MLSRFSHWCRAAWPLLLLPLLALAVVLRPKAPPPNILVILVDTLRADRLGAYGNTRGLTPFLDQLAGQGTLFRKAYSATSWTSPSVASLFTSRYPSQHRIVNYDSKLAADEITLATRLRQAGYTTAAFVANSQISAPRGFADGFSYWWGEQSPRTRAADLCREVIAWLDDSKVGRRDPIFLYVHFLDPHAPYLPPEPFRSRFERPAPGVRVNKAGAKMGRRHWDRLTRAEIELLESLYDGEVASVDDEVRLLVAELERRGLLEHAVIVVTADHGEEFMEHGGMDHGRTLYNELINVPLIVRVPNQPRGAVVGQNVSLIDIAPTLLELAGAPAEPRFEGRSLVPLLAGASPPAAARGAALAADTVRTEEASGAHDELPSGTVAAELLANGAVFDLRQHTSVIIEGSAKLLVRRSGEAEFYDLERDPRETRPNPEGSDQQRQQLMAELAEAEQHLSARVGSAPGVAPLDEAARETLHALGYDPPQAR